MGYHQWIWIAYNKPFGDALTVSYLYTCMYIYLYYIMLYYIVLYYIVVYQIIILHYIILYHIVLSYILYCIIIILYIYILYSYYTILAQMVQGDTSCCIAITKLMPTMRSFQTLNAIFPLYSGRSLCLLL